MVPVYFLEINAYDTSCSATLIFEVEFVACNPRNGLSLGIASEEKNGLEELKKQREIAAATKEEEKKKREEAKAAAAARIQANKLDANLPRAKAFRHSSINQLD